MEFDDSKNASDMSRLPLFAQEHSLNISRNHKRAMSPDDLSNYHDGTPTISNLHNLHGSIGFGVISSASKPVRNASGSIEPETKLNNFIMGEQSLRNEAYGEGSEEGGQVQLEYKSDVSIENNDE